MPIEWPNCWFFKLSIVRGQQIWQTICLMSLTNPIEYNYLETSHKP